VIREFFLKPHFTRFEVWVFMPSLYALLGFIAGHVRWVF
jgi:hypothetical protein